MLVEPLILEKIYDSISYIFPNGVRADIDSKFDETKFIFPTAEVWRCYPDDLLWYVEKIKLKQSQLSWILANHALELPQLSTIFYDDKTVEHLNKNGLHIILLENLLKYDGPKINLDRYTLEEVLPTLENNGAVIGKFQNPKAMQLDSVQDLIDNNRLTNVTVYVCEKDVDTFFHKYNMYTTMKFVWKDFYLLQDLEKFNSTDDIPKKDIKYTFVNSNWRYDTFRHVIAAYLSNYNSKLSWYYTSTQEDFKNLLWFNPPQSLINGFEKLNQRTPINLDKHITTATPVTGSLIDRFSKLPTTDFFPNSINSNIYEGVFCSIVSESGFFDETAYVTEKTMWSIFNLMPFVIVGPPGALAALKDLGFKTFDKWWDEGYDNEKDHAERIIKIFKLIDYIASLPKDVQASVTKEMNETLLYNKQRLQNLHKDITL